MLVKLFNLIYLIRFTDVFFLEYRNSSVRCPSKRWLRHPLRESGRQAEGG